MDSTGYYLRLRGQVSGPFTLDELKKLVARGAASRIHEISRDQIAWAAAGTLEELFSGQSISVAIASAPTFPSVARSPAASVTPIADKAKATVAEAPLAVSELATLAPAPPALAPAEPPASRRFYYRQRGIVIGPLPWPSLKHLAQIGKVEPSAEVWSSAGEEPGPASSMPGLMTGPREMPAEASPQVTRTHLWLMVGIAAASLLVVAATLSYIFFAR